MLYTRVCVYIYIYIFVILRILKYFETVRQNRPVSKYSVILDKPKRGPKQN